MKEKNLWEKLGENILFSIKKNHGKTSKFPKNIVFFFLWKNLEIIQNMKKEIKTKFYGQNCKVFETLPYFKLMIYGTL